MPHHAELDRHRALVADETARVDEQVKLSHGYNGPALTRDPRKRFCGTVRQLTQCASGTWSSTSAAARPNISQPSKAALISGALPGPHQRRSLHYAPLQSGLN